MKSFCFLAGAALVVVGAACGSSNGDTATGSGGSAGGPSSTTGGKGGSTPSTGGSNPGGAGGSAGGGASGGGGATGGAPQGGGGSGGVSNGGAGGTGGAGTGGSGGAKPECTAGDTTCGPGKYCLSANCGGGTCATKPDQGTGSNEPGLVCGCNGVTYWNAHLAATLGVSVASQGECPGSSMMACQTQSDCTALGSGYYCDLEATDATQCTAMVTGTCWALPVECPLDDPEHGHACTNGDCATRCALVASHFTWWPDDLGCP